MSRELFEREKQFIKKQFDREMIQRERKIKMLEEQNLALFKEKQLSKTESSSENRQLLNYKNLLEELVKRASGLQRELEIAHSSNDDMRQQLDAMRFALKDESKRSDELSKNITKLKSINQNLENEISLERIFFKRQVDILETEIAKLQEMRITERVLTQISQPKVSENSDIAENFQSYLQKQSEYLHERTLWQEESNSLKLVS